jgi:hypothetical protein
MSDRPRDAAISIELTEGSGPILTACSVGDVLEVYKVDRCFELQSPDAVDPNQTDPNAPWIVKHVSAYGAGNEIVARTFLLAVELANHVTFKPSFNKLNLLFAVKACRNSLLECDRISKRITEEENRLVNEYQFLKVKGNVVSSFPVFQGLPEVAGGFLFNAKQCLQNASEIFNSFFGTSFHGPHFHKMLSWCKEHLQDSGLTDFLTDYEPRARWITDLRNYFEHPGDKKTEIRDFYWEPEKHSTHLPTWNITGQVGTSISEDSAAIVILLTDVIEALLLLCAIEAAAHFPYMIVPRSPVKPEMPIRYSVEIDPRILSPG